MEIARQVEGLFALADPLAGRLARVQGNGEL